MFIAELVEKFIRQADAAQDLTVSEYPKTYRALNLRVSFGQGNFARIPWISFLGYEQTTSYGIYPVVLYYKSQGVLVVAYGISVTTPPKGEWRHIADKRTIDATFATRHLEPPDKYGNSFVHAVFPIADGVDAQQVQVAVDEVIAKFQEQFALQHGGAAPIKQSAAQAVSYTISDATVGLFIEETKFAEIVALLRRKKNLILQGPPGVGKTFVCKRVADALIGEKGSKRMQMIQFHQAYSYEDFMQGYRPSATGFRLKNGLFYEFCEEAKNDPAGIYVFVIDEINRGNLSKVFGEAMMLIESDKRGPDWAISLAYADSADAKFYIPSNVYLLGLMNTADRSLALVDYALRRRFAFVGLEPSFESELFFDHLEAKGAEPALIEAIVEKMSSLNKKIADDTSNLGPGFRIGHSFFCDFPVSGKPDKIWYDQVITNEIAPLLREYYFDDPDKVQSIVSGLLNID